MTKLILEKDVIIKRMDGIESELAELENLKKLPEIDFNNTGYKLAHYHLHRCLEGVFNISSHILSRFPGHQATQYKEIAIKLGELEIVSPEFANTKLANMAKYRNRLVHFYAQITPKELKDILTNNLVDIELFLQSIKNLLQNPNTFGLHI